MSVQMLPILNNPQHWRDRAEEARAVADQLDDPDARRTMLGIADEYERLALNAERRLAAMPKKPD